MLEALVHVNEFAVA
jgi:hypothetical protein